jgi:hypothetical protein
VVEGGSYTKGEKAAIVEFSVGVASFSGGLITQRICLLL